VIRYCLNMVAVIQYRQFDAEEREYMNSNLIIGNLCTLLAMGANAISSTRKTAKGVLAMQSVGQLIYFISAIVLKGYSAAVQNAVSIFRNVAAIRNVKSKTVEWVLTIAGVALGIWFNNRGIIGLLPVLGNLQYTLAIFRLKDNQRLLKISFLLSVASFLIFNVVLYNFVGLISDAVVVITTSVVLIRERNQEKKA